MRGKTIVYDHTDGCSKQCRCATSMQLLTMLSMQFEVVIDRMVNAAGHGKCMIDGMNAVSKHHCADCMTRIVNPNDDLDNNLKQRFESWLHKDGKEHSLAEQCVRLLSEPNRKNGVMCAGNKCKKREENRVHKERHYCTVKKENVKHQNLKMDTIKLTNIKPQNGKSLQHTGSNTRCNFRADPDLGVGVIAVRRIPCACQPCLDQLKLPWSPNIAPQNQPRYAQNKKCSTWNMFLGENDWDIVHITCTGVEEDNFQESANVALEENAMLVQMSASIGDFGALAVTTTKKSQQTFSLFQCSSEAHKFSVEKFVGETGMKLPLNDGELVADVLFFDHLAGEWYVPSNEGTVSLAKVVCANALVLPIKADNLLPARHPQGTPPFSKERVEHQLKNKEHQKTNKLVSGGT